MEDFDNYQENEEIPRKDDYDWSQHDDGEGFERYDSHFDSSFSNNHGDMSYEKQDDQDILSTHLASHALRLLEKDYQSTLNATFKNTDKILEKGKIIEEEEEEKEEEHQQQLNDNDTIHRDNSAAIPSMDDNYTLDNNDKAIQEPLDVETILRIMSKFPMKLQSNINKKQKNIINRQRKPENFK